MPLPRTLIHPRLAASMPQFFPSTCTILDPNIADNELNERVANLPTMLAGHGNISCRIAPTQGERSAVQEQRREYTTYEESRWECQLNGYYPDIRLHMVASVDGEMYDIQGVLHIKPDYLTRLNLERVR